MSLQKINTRTVVLILMIVAAASMRLVSYEFKFLSNFTPVGAIALFGGAYFAGLDHSFALGFGNAVDKV